MDPRCHTVDDGIVASCQVGDARHTHHGTPDDRWPTRAPKALAPPWAFVVVLLTWGFLGALPILVAARRSGERALVWAGVGYALVAVGALALHELSPDDPVTHEEVGGLHDLALGLQGTLLVVVMVHLLTLRRRSPMLPPTSRDPAVLAALARRGRRREARALAAADPMLARELRVGRPDLPHRYDDGGLVDLVSAPAVVIAGVCGVSATHADDVVRARDAAGAALRDVDDLVGWITVPFPVWEQIRDRGIVLGLPRTGDHTGRPVHFGACPDADG